MHYLDQLRWIALVLLVFFHATEIYGSGGWVTRSEDRAPLLGTVGAFLHTWRLPVQFFVAGASTALLLAALRARSSGGQDAARSGKAGGHRRAFRKDRILRLGLPYLAGIVPFVLPQVFITWWGTSRELGFVTYWLNQILQDPLLLLSPAGFQVIGSHLWFLPTLLGFSLLAPLLADRLAGPRGRRAVATLATTARPVPLILAPIVVVGAACYPLAALYPQYDAMWAATARWGAAFAAGMVVVAHPAMAAAVAAALPRSLAAGIVLTVAWHAQSTLGLVRAPGWHPLTGVDTLIDAGMAWTWTLVLAGAAIRWLNKPHRVLGRLAEGSLPFYAAHQIVLVLVAELMIAFVRTGPYLGVLGLTAATVGLTWLLYEVAIRPWTPMRLIFGLRRRPSSGTRRAGWSLPGPPDHRQPTVSRTVPSTSASRTGAACDRS